MTTFTGSTGVGRMVAQAAAKDLKKVSLELGGKNLQVVFLDADLDAALEKVVFGAYFNQGEALQRRLPAPGTRRHRRRVHRTGRGARPGCHSRGPARPLPLPRWEH